VPTIRFEKEGQQVGCIEGANLRRAALDAGINPYTGLNNLNNCGGVGQCGTCVVEVVEGARNLSPRSDVEQVYLADRPASYRLSCRTTVNGDVTIRTRPRTASAKAPTACWAPSKICLAADRSPWRSQGTICRSGFSPTAAVPPAVRP
jgi:ferredoxin